MAGACDKIKVMECFAEYFHPDTYDLSLKLSREDESLYGRAKIDGRLASPKIKIIKLHAEKLEIKSVKMALAEQGEPAVTCDFRHQDGVLEILLSEEEYQDDLQFEIEFSGRLNHNMQGCYLSSYQWQGKDYRIAATQFEACCARQAFPCIDEPAAKAVFRLTLEVPDYQAVDTVISNMPLRTQQGNKFEFEPTPPMSTYLLAWVVGPFRRVSSVNPSGIKVTSYGALNQPLESLLFANQTAERALEYYQKRFRIPYPLPKLDQVALPDFEAGAMENWGLITFRESCMLADRDAPLDSKKSVAVTVTHEIAHQWFGDLVTMQWWDGLWLNESFATIMEYAATDALYPEFKIWTNFFTDDSVAALERDALPGVQAVYQPVRHPDEIETLFDSAIVYAKGARLILMLMRLSGEENFNRALHDYFKKHQYANTIGDDLWASLEPYVKFDVRGFMQTWISQPGYPALHHCHNGEKVWWEQQRLLIDGSTDDSKWPLPAVEDDMSGHYVLDLSEAEFENKLVSFSNLGLEQKLRILIDRMLLAKSGVAPIVPLLDLLPKFRAEQNAGIWRILASIIADLKIFCPPQSTTYQNFQQYLRGLLGLQLKKMRENADNQTLSSEQLDLRNTVISLALYAADRGTLERLNRLYQGDLTKIEPELRIFVLAAKMRRDEAAVFDEFLLKYQKTEDPDLKSDLLYALSRAEKIKHQQRLLALLKEPKIVRAQDHIFLFAYLLRNYKTKAATLDWLTRNWAYVERITGQKTLEDYLRYGASVILDAAEADKFFGFFDQEAENPMLARAIELAHVSVAARLARIEEHGEAFAQKLAYLQGKHNKIQGN